MRYAKTKIAALAAAVVATASLPLLGDVTATYTAGATSLADGKITFAYDGSGNVTELRMRSVGNETLTLTGAPLVFADGARIVPGQNTNVIENAWTAAGELALGVTNMVWSGDADLSSNDWTTVLTGVRLDDISPVGAIRVRNSTRYSFAPYVVERGDGTLTVEFQYKFDGSGNSNKYLQCGKVELKQDGDDVKARIVGSGYFGANNTGDDGHHKYVGYIGWSMFGSPAFTVTQNAYTFKELAFAPRRETYDYTNGLLTASFETVVARNVFVEDLEILYGAGGYRQSLGAAFGRATLTPRHVKLEDGVLSAQMVYAQSASRSKCVKVELRQSGSDVVARVSYAKYNSTNDPDFDFDDEASKYTSLDDGWHDYTLATDYSINGYGIDMLALRRKSPDRVAFKVSGEKTLGAMSGNGVEVGFAAAAGGAEVIASGANTMTDSAYVISGSGDADMTFTCGDKDVLPDGTVDVYGEGTKLAIKGKSQANAAITMHPGSELVNDTAPVTAKLAKDVVLDAATLTMSKLAYVNDLTFLNGSVADGTLRVGYTAGDGNWKVSGTGVSTCGATVNLIGANKSGERWLTIDVVDTVAGAGVDFIVSGAIATADWRYPYVSFVKAGEGTMRMDGSMATLTNLPVRVVAGVLAITTSGAVDAQKGRLSLEGGALEFADGTTNVVSGVTLTESAEISVGAGATLTIGSLTVPDGATLALSGDVLNGSVRVTSALDDTTLSRIRLNGKRAVQSSSGRLCTIGLTVTFY